MEALENSTLWLELVLVLALLIMLSLFCFKLFCMITLFPVAEKGLDEYEVGV
jgi:hypothetical protein